MCDFFPEKALAQNWNMSSMLLLNELRVFKLPSDQFH